MIEPIQNHLGFISQNSAFICFIGGFLAGEEMLLILTYLANAGHFPFWHLMVFTFLGITLCDFTFYFIGKLKLVQSYINNSKRLSHSFDKISNIYYNVCKHSTWKILLYTKFIYGTRLISLVYLGMRNVSVKEFLRLNIIIGISWLLIVVSIGIILSESIELIINTFHSIQMVSLFILVFIIVGIYIKKWIEKRILSQ